MAIIQGIKRPRARANRRGPDTTTGGHAMPKGTCTIVERGTLCGRDAYGHGMCNMHWQRWRKSGEPLMVSRMVHIGTPEQRFWPKVNKDGPIPEHHPELGACWVWLPKLDRYGYGLFSPAGHTYGAHIYGYELQIGPIPDGYDIHHRCETPSCVRGSHLIALTRRDHKQEHLLSHCYRGHAYVPENTYVWHGKRQCRACMRIREGKRKR